MADAAVIRASEVYGRGYNRFRRSKHRYRVVKGSRASKKSKNTALDYIEKLERYPEANLLCVRKTFRAIKDSQWTDLKWAARRLRVDGHWVFKTSPLEAVNTRTGQKILFRGLDDPLKVTSITVDTGYLCWCWIEEAYEIMSEADFDTLDESIRGRVPESLWKQVTLTFNPWNERHWIKHRFFDVVVGEDGDGNKVYRDRLEATGSPESEDGEILAITTNYTCNEWLDESDLRKFESMRQRNPRRYQVAGLGKWGVVDGLVFENWKDQRFTLDDLPKDAQSAFGLDFGYTNDPTAGFCGFYSPSERRLYVWDELYSKGLSNARIWAEVQRMGYAKESWTADSAEPKSIAELKGYGMRVRAAEKGRDSVNNGIQWLQDLEIVVHPRCTSFITEISCYQWKKDRFNKMLNEPEDDSNHLMDAMRYGCERFMAKSGWMF